MKINSIRARKILDSRSNWTIETTVCIDGGQGVASVPSGISVGKYEAKSLPAEQALDKIQLLSKELVNKDVGTQEDLDNFMIGFDGSENKGILGANTLLSISIAFAKAVSAEQNVPLYKYISNISESNVDKTPKIMMLIFEGGKHGSSDISIQEFMVVANSVSEGDLVYDAARKILLEKRLPTEVGLEGAFSPISLDDLKILSLLKEITPLPLALDIAASSATGTIPDYSEILSEFNVESIEDPYGEEEWSKWQEFTKKYASKSLVVGDDLVVTNPKKIKRAVELKACTGAIIKPNQIGTITETLEAVKIAREGGLKTVVSHRSGETNDSFIADLAVGVGANYVKFGAPSRGERVAKYNRLLEIQSSL